MKTYARIMYDRHGGNRRCVVVVANNENDAADMLDKIEHGLDVDFDFREWRMKSGEIIPYNLELV